MKPDEGEIYIDDKLVNKIPPQERSAVYVPQQYALFPHMNVIRNVTYGPWVRGYDLDLAIKNGREILDMLYLSGWENAYPHELSGGMKQRVALARAIASNSKILLLDEPLGALDAKIRAELRYELRELVKSLNLTAVHATHDIEEAMLIADKIVILNNGIVEQVGTPEEIYENPKSIFVANYVTEGNFLEGIIKSIENTEDRELFRQCMIECGIGICKSATATTKEEAWKIANKIGFPLMIRVAYTLGGQGSGIAHNEEEFRELVEKALAQSVISQILIEEYVGGWKEIEYEVMRDNNDNTITVCNMENFDPVGIHTGESIVIAPSQTLSDEEYQMLRSASIRAIRHIGIIGECNIQYALHPTSKRYVAIEVNARLSRSSALASKATGYPLAYIAAKLAIGYSLLELNNKVTNITTACFEPAMDYVALKIPRWNMEKFRRVSRRIGTQMKSIGEVMSIGRTFEEAFQKSIRMLDIGMRGAVGNDKELEWMNLPIEDLKYELNHPTDLRFLLIPIAIKRGLSIDEIFVLTKIDRWFLYKIAHIVEIENMLKEIPLEIGNTTSVRVIQYAKRYGFSDGQICRHFNIESHAIRRFRHKTGIQPVTKQIDTLAAEWPANTNYLYLLQLYLPLGRKIK